MGTQMNIGDLFDSPLKVLIIAIVVLVLFGSRKMPDAARSLGRSMRILKSEVSKIHDDDDQPESAPQAQALTAPTQQPQPVGEAVANGAPVTEAPRTQQPS